jgi:hypothetical protein
LKSGTALGRFVAAATRTIRHDRRRGSTPPGVHLPPGSAPNFCLPALPRIPMPQGCSWSPRLRPLRSAPRTSRAASCRPPCRARPSAQCTRGLLPGVHGGRWSTGPPPSVGGRQGRGIDGLGPLTGRLSRRRGSGLLLRGPGRGGGLGLRLRDMGRLAWPLDS